MSVGQIMLYGGVGAFGVLLIILLVLLKVFKAERKRLAEKIEKEFEKE